MGPNTAPLTELPELFRGEGGGMSVVAVKSRIFEQNPGYGGRVPGPS